MTTDKMRELLGLLEAVERVDLPGRFPHDVWRLMGALREAIATGNEAGGDEVVEGLRPWFTGGGRYDWQEAMESNHPEEWGAVGRVVGGR